jgi:hypothetical protein
MAEQGNPGSIRAGRAYISLGADSKELEAKIDKAKVMLKQLKEGLGSRSGFKDLVEIFKGAGAVAGLALAARALNDMSQAAVKWRDAMAQGGDAAAGATEELIQSLPVLGQIRQAGLAIQELFTGEEAAAKALREEAERLNKSMDARVAMQKAALAATEEHVAAMRRLNNEGDLIGRHPEDKARLKARQELDDQTIARRAGAEAKMEKSRADEKAAADPIQETIRKLADRSKYLREEMPSGVNSRVDIEEAEKLESQVQAHYRSINSIKEKAIKDRKAISDAARAEEAKAEDNHFREMIEREQKAAAEAAAENLKAAQEAAKEQEQQAEQAAERAAEAAKAGMERQVDAIIQSEKMKEAGKELAEFLTFGLSGDLTKAADVERIVKKVKDAERRTSASVTFSGYGLQGLGSTGPIDRIAKATEETAKNTRRNGAGQVFQ